MMSVTDVTVWRALLKADFQGNLYNGNDPVADILTPTFEATTYIDRYGETQTRPADNQATQVGTETQLHVSKLKGTSVWDRRGRFGMAHWRYFEVREGSELPEPLTLRCTHSIQHPLPNDQTRTPVTWKHYQIEPKSRMTKTAYIAALDLLARAAVAKLVENVH